MYRKNKLVKSLQQKKNRHWLSNFSLFSNDICLSFYIHHHIKHFRLQTGGPSHIKTLSIPNTLDISKYHGYFL